MDYARAFAKALQALRAEGRYRVFADIRRSRGQFPAASHFASGGGARNHGVVLQRLSGHGPEPAGAGRHARGARCGGRGLGRHAQHLRHHPLPCRARGGAGRPARQGGGAGVHLGLRRQRHHARHTAKAAARLDHLLGREEPRLHDRRHPQRRRRKGDLAQQRPRRPRGEAESRPARAAEGDRLRVGLFHGRPDLPDRGHLRPGARNTARSPTSTRCTRWAFTVPAAAALPSATASWAASTSSTARWRRGSASWAATSPPAQTCATPSAPMRRGSSSRPRWRRRLRRVRWRASATSRRAAPSASGIRSGCAR